MKIAFDIKYRPQIESGEYKVEIKNGNPVEIICFDRRDDTTNKTLVGIIRTGTVEEIAAWTKDGKLCDAVFPQNHAYDLFIITPEPELSEFERKVADVIDLWHEDYVQWSKPGASAHNYPDQIKPDAAELLSLAREQFIKDGYVIEKKAFHDAVKKIDDKHLAEMSVEYSLHCKVENGTRHAIMNWEAFQKVAQKFIDIGKAEALKDLPRWKECREYTIRSYGKEHVEYRGDGHYLVAAGMEILVSDLEKLPGFNE